MTVAFTTEVTPEAISALVTRLTSGLQAVTLAGTDCPTEGKALDFVTGTLKGRQASRLPAECADRRPG